MNGDMQTMQAEELATDDPLTDMAINTARQVFKWADDVTDVHPAMCPDGEGGIRVEWFAGNCSVRVVIHGDGSGYLYHRAFEESGVVPLTQENLTYWLDMLH